MEDLLDMLLGDPGEAQKHGGAILDGRALPGRGLKDAALVVGMATKGKLATPDFNTRMKDADAAMNEDIIEPGDGVGVIGS